MHFSSNLALLYTFIKIVEYLFAERCYIWLIKVRYTPSCINLMDIKKNNYESIIIIQAQINTTSINKIYINIEIKCLSLTSNETARFEYIEKCVMASKMLKLHMKDNWSVLWSRWRSKCVLKSSHSFTHTIMMITLMSKGNISRLYRTIHLKIYHI